MRDLDIEEFARRCRWCDDPYADHYVTFDRETTGCSGVGTSDTGGTEPCACGGFEEYVPSLLPSSDGKVVVVFKVGQYLIPVYG